MYPKPRLRPASSRGSARHNTEIALTFKDNGGPTDADGTALGIFRQVDKLSRGVIRIVSGDRVYKSYVKEVGIFFLKSHCGVVDKAAKVMISHIIPVVAEGDRDLSAAHHGTLEIQIARFRKRDVRISCRRV